MPGLRYLGLDSVNDKFFKREYVENLGDISYWRQVERCCSIDSIVCRGCCLNIIMSSIITHIGITSIIEIIMILVIPKVLMKESYLVTRRYF